MKIALRQVIEAIEMADDAYTYFYDSQTGKTVYLADSLYTGETDEELIDQLENSRGRFYRFPTKYEIHEYNIMAAFVDSLSAGRARQELELAIHGKGAFRKFKNGIRYHRLEDIWYKFQAEAYRELAVRWCRDNELDVDE